MSEPAHDLRMTVPEFLRWDDGTETRYELVGGRPVAMAPAKDPHGRIAVSAALEMRRRLVGRRPCTAMTEAPARRAACASSAVTAFLPEFEATISTSSGSMG